MPQISGFEPDIIRCYHTCNVALPIKLSRFVPGEGFEPPTHIDCMNQLEQAGY